MKRMFLTYMSISALLCTSAGVQKALSAPGDSFTIQGSSTAPRSLQKIAQDIQANESRLSDLKFRERLPLLRIRALSHAMMRASFDVRESETATSQEEELRSAFRGIQQNTTNLSVQFANLPHTLEAWMEILEDAVAAQRWNEVALVSAYLAPYHAENTKKRIFLSLLQVQALFEQRNWEKAVRTCISTVASENFEEHIEFPEINQLPVSCSLALLNFAKHASQNAKERENALSLVDQFAHNKFLKLSGAQFERATLAIAQSYLMIGNRQSAIEFMQSVATLPQFVSSAKVKVFLNALNRNASPAQHPELKDERYQLLNARIHLLKGQLSEAELSYRSVQSLGVEAEFEKQTLAFAKSGRVPAKDTLVAYAEEDATAFGPFDSYESRVVASRASVCATVLEPYSLQISRNSRVVAATNLALLQLQKAIESHESESSEYLMQATELFESSLQEFLSRANRLFAEKVKRLDTASQMVWRMDQPKTAIERTRQREILLQQLESPSGKLAALKRKLRLQRTIDASRERAISDIVLALKEIHGATVQDSSLDSVSALWDEALSAAKELDALKKQLRAQDTRLPDSSPSEINALSASVSRLHEELIERNKIEVADFIAKGKKTLLDRMSFVSQLEMHHEVQQSMRTREKIEDLEKARRERKQWLKLLRESVNAQL